MYNSMPNKEEGIMKSLFRVLLILLTAAMPFYGEGSPHLILYFDINKTLIASDKPRISLSMTH